MMEEDQKADGKMEEDAMKDDQTMEQDVTATVKEAEDALYHAVNAKLPDPPEDSFYEGWLVLADTPPRIISTGEMMKNSESAYVLEFRSDELYNGYNMVVITLEETRDDIPEEHILEGVVS